MPQRALVERNFWLWLLASFTWMGLVLYYWMNVSDLQILATKQNLKEVPSPAPPEVLTTLTGLSYVLIPLSLITHPIMNYYKFEKLHEYIQFHPIKQETMPRRGIDMVIVTIVFNILLVTTVVFFTYLIIIGGFISLGFTLAVGILFIYWSYKWQKAMNERVALLRKEE